MATTRKVAHFAPWEPLSEDVNPDRRRAKRMNLAFSVELFGFNIANEYFTERGVTVNVSSAGCQLRLTNQVNVKYVVALRIAVPEGSPAPPENPALFLICWVKRVGEKWAAGAQALQHDAIWPDCDADESAGRLRRLTAAGA
jgi:hypothetical protein